MKHPITVHWLGIRKDSGRGTIWGYFTLAGKPDLQVPKMAGWYEKHIKDPAIDEDGVIRHYCYVFTGKIGKKLNIEKRIYDDFLREEINAKQKNYRAADIEKTMDKWGTALDEELNMYLTYATLLG